MPIVSKTTSALGNRIAPKILSFMKKNANAMKNGAKEEEGLEAIAQAIAYGISIALNDSVVQNVRKTSMATVITAPPAPTPVGNLIDTIFTSIEKAQYTEVT